LREWASFKSYNRCVNHPRPSFEKVQPLKAPGTYAAKQVAITLAIDGD